jgi:hypothetical protein
LTIIAIAAALNRRAKVLVRVGSGGLKGSTMGLARPYRPFDGFGKVVCGPTNKGRQNRF